MRTTLLLFGLLVGCGSDAPAPVTTSPDVETTTATAGLEGQAVACLDRYRELPEVEAAPAGEGL